MNRFAILESYVGHDIFTTKQFKRDPKQSTEKMIELKSFHSDHTFTKRSMSLYVTE